MNEEIRVLIENLKQYTLQYAAEHGVVPDSRGFVQCLFPDHDDHDPSMHWWDENNLFFCFSCLNGEEDVFTYEKGYIPIKDIEIGMTTIGLNGQKNRILNKQQVDGSNKKMYGIKTGIGRYLTKVTEDHKHFVINYKCLDVHKDGQNYIKNKDGRIPRIEFRKKELEIKTTNELNRGDYLFIPKTKIYYDGILYNDWKKITNKGIKPKIIEKIKLNEDLCWLLGIYLAEGSLYRGGVRWTICGEQKHLAEKIKTILKKDLNLESTIHDFKQKKNTYDVTCSCTDFSNFIKKYFGEYCDKKIIDQYFLHIDYKLQKAIIDGLYAGDGSNDIPGRYTVLSLANKNIINQIKLMCINNNIPFNYTEAKERIGKDGILRKPVYTLYFREKESGRILYDRLDNGQEGAFILIDEIKEIEKQNIVYDITTDDNSFLTKNFLTHNCGRAADIFTLANIFEGKPLAGPDFLEDNVFYLAEKFGQPYLHLRKTLTPEEIERQMYFRTMKLFSDYVVSHANKEYLANREIEEKTAKTLSIGSVDNYQNCINYLVNAGCQREILNNIGIIANRVNENQLIMIIKDEYGRPMSFVSRHMHFVKGESKFPKYTNGNETIIFNKSRMLYCWSDIKKQYNTLEKLLVVEGYIDAVSAYQKGYRNVVALGSASFTDEHINLLEKENRIKNVAFALDNDETGRKRMFSIVGRLKNQKTTNEYQFALYKEQGKDLDEILKKFDKKVSLTNIFELVSMFDYEIRCLKENYGDNIDESAMFDHFIGIISKTQRPKEREEQAKSLAKYLPSYSYKTILSEIEMILSEEKINYKKDITSVLDKAYKEATNNPEYALEIIDGLKDDIENVQSKYDRTQQGVFESSVSRFKESEKYKMNSDLYQIQFGIPWLDDLNLKPGNSVVMAGLPNTGKSTVFQCLMHNIAVNSPNGVIIYIATDDSEEMIYDNLTAQLSGLPREYCGNPYFDSQFGLNSSQLPEAQQYFEKYCKTREFIERLIINKKLIILDVKQKIDNWNGFKKAIGKIVADKELENKYKIMVVDSVNKISVDGIKDENQTAGFLSAEIKKLNERDRILGFLNFELNKMRDNSKLSQFALSGSKRMFYDCNVLGFIYNPTRNLQEFEGTEYETKMKWQLQINEFNSIPQPVIVTIQSKSKAGNNSMNARPYFYKLNEFTSKLTPIPLASEEHQHYLKIWREEWNNLYTSNYSKA